MREFMAKFLCEGNGSISCEEAMREILLAAGDNSKSYLLPASQIVFRYRLLDIFADVLDCPKHHTFREVPRMARPSSDLALLWKVNLFITV
jgi:hypothetical protein